ncbi:MAG: hypothetical protein HY545_02055 [Candidatus Doudnabacteria bacterium]|nr:hypothetical protein [Candidatus Doudnabacteria bacterium]
MRKQEGQIIIISLIFMTIVTLVVGSLVSYATVQIKSHKQAVGRVEALSIAEAGIEAAVWKLNNQQGYNGESGTVYGAGTYNITVTDLSGSSKLIKAEAFTPSGKRTVQATATTGTTNISFNYGVQVGAGGLEMDNNSTVIGNVYSNGPIKGSSNGVKIGGTAVSAGAAGKIEDVQDIDGDATAHFLEDISVDGSTNSYSLLRATVGGNAVSDSISNCTIGGNATYDTKTNCTIGGTQTTPNPANFQDPANEPLPISDDQINAWEAEAEAGGVITSQTYSGISNSLGPKKINGNLKLDNNAVLTVTGTIWVTGEIKLSNGSIIQLDSSYGSLSGVVIAGTDGDSSAGYIELDNNSLVKGSGTAGSYIMLFSQRNNTGSTAIKTSNNADSAILYAGTGVVELDNNAQLKEVTSYKLKLKNGADVIYESGLANANFSSGPAGGWELLDQSWQLLN